MTQKQYLGLIGFAFVASWVAFGLGYAILCLLGAGLFYAAGGIVQGEIDLGDLQDRIRAVRGGDATPAPGAGAGGGFRPAGVPRRRVR